MFANGSCCWNHEYKILIEQLSDQKGTFIDPIRKIGLRAWLWQSCTEFGWYPTTLNQIRMPFEFHLDVDFYISLCSLAFPELEFDKKSVEKNINATNVEYGGINPDISNIVFVHGSVDPWHALGVIKDLDSNKSATAIFNYLYSHCENDKDGKKKIRKLVATWLN